MDSLIANPSESGAETDIKAKSLFLGHHGTERQNVQLGNKISNCYLTQLLYINPFLL